MAPRIGDARAAILRRRAFFISSVTALVGCDPKPSAPPPSPEPVAIPPGGGELPEPSGKPGSGTRERPGKMPPLDVPAGINDAARRQFEHLARSIPELHARFDEIAKSLPSDCPIAEDRCAERWSALARALVEIEERMPQNPVCPGTSEGAKLYQARLDAHRAYLEDRRRATSLRLMEAIAPASDEGKRRWAAHMDKAKSAYPRVCLNYSCQDW